MPRRLNVPCESARSRRDSFVLLAVSLLAAAPIWATTYPPMTDLPQHAAEIALLRNVQDPQFRFSALFEINWFTPYLTGYMLVYSLAPLLGITAACKVVISLALAALPLSTALVMSETGTDRRWALLTVTAVYGFSYHWGFLNFIVAAPLGMVFLWLVMRHARKPSLMTSALLGAMINVLFFCHAMICAFFAVVSTCYLYFSFETCALRTVIKRIAPLGAALPVMIAWGMKTLAHPLASGPMVWAFASTGADLAAASWGRITGIIPCLLGLPPSPISTILGFAVIGLPFLAGVRANRRLTAWVPFLVCVGTLLLLPEVVFGTAYAHERFSVFILPFFLIGLTGSTLSLRLRLARVGVPLVAVAWTAAVFAQAATFQAEAEAFNDILARMEPGQRALSMVFLRDSQGSIAPPFLHFPSWYAAQKKGVVDMSFAVTHVELVVYRPGRIPRASWGFEWNPASFDWQLFRGHDYRYFLVRSITDLEGALFRSAPCPVHLRYHVDKWWLYENDPSCM